MAKIDSGVEFDKEAHHEKLTQTMAELSPYLLRIPVHLHKKVKIKLAKDGLKLREILITKLEEYINE